MSNLESQSERQILFNPAENGQAISNEANAALRDTSLQEFTTYRDAGKSIDPNLIPSLTIEGLNSPGDSAGSLKTSAVPNIDDAIAHYDAGTVDLHDTRVKLREANRDIYGGKPGGDEEGRRDLREARRELKNARREFKELLRDLGGGEGSEEVREGLRDLKKADKEIGRAIRRDKGYDQGGAMEHIREALQLLDGNTSEHVDRRGKITTDHGAYEINEGFNKAILQA